MSSSRPIRVLHVDDEPAFCDLVETFLEREQETFEVITRTDPTTVPAFLETNAVDCLVSDYEMPQCDGLELLESVREADPNLPFILFTGKGTEAVASQAISAGVTDYLQKDAGSDQFTLLANRIKNAVERRERDRQFETLVDNLPGVVHRSSNSPGWQFEFIRGEVEELTGYDASRLQTGEVSWGEDVVHPDDRERVWERVQEQLEADDSYELTFRIITKSGEEKQVWERGKRVGVTDTGKEILEGFTTDISERKEREATIRRLKERLELAVEGANLGVWDWDMRTDDVEFNDQWAKMLGHTLSEIEPKLDAWERRVHPDDMAAVEEALDAHRAGETPYYDTEHRMRTADDEWKWIRDIGQIVERGPDGTPERAVGIHVDIDESKRTEQILKQERERFSTLFENFPEPTIRYRYENDDPIVQSINESFEGVFGYDEATAVGNSIDDLIVPDEQQEEAKQITKRARSDELRDVEVMRETVDGERCFKFRHISLPTDEKSDGFAVYTDLHEQKNRERELEQYEQFIEHSPDIVFLLDEDGTVMYQSPTPQEDSSFEPIDLVGEYPHDHVHPADTERLQKAYKQILDTPDEIVVTEFRVPDFEGGWRWFESRAQNFLGREPIDGILVSSRDITERKENEQQLARYNHLLEKLHETTQTLLEATEPEAVAEVVIESVEDLFEFDVAGIWFYEESSEQLEPVALTENGQELVEQVPIYSAETESLSWDAFEEQRTRIIDDMSEHEGRYNPSSPIQSELIVPFGEYGVLNIGSGELNSFSEEDAKRLELWAGTVTAALARIEQLKRLTEREGELKRERNRLDEFASFVSHDLRNPLNVASSRLELAREDCDSPELDKIDHALSRMEQLIDDLLELARQGETVGETEWVNVQAVATRCWNTVATERATIAYETQAEILADESRLAGVFENLFRNSIEHGGEAVRITVGELSDGSGFYVADTGVGIAEDEHEKVFQSGYSTNEDGTGFGLAIVEEIVEAHGWDITVTESKAGGARFEISGVDLR